MFQGVLQNNQNILRVLDFERVGGNFGAGVK